VSRAYLDHASSAPVRPEASAALRAALDGLVGDPGRLHAEGRAARVALEQAREQVADFFDARPREVVFTASGTEAINAAVHGALSSGGHAVTTAVEHSAVTAAVARAATSVTLVGVDRHGRVDPDEVVAAVRPDTALVSVQIANHEVGTVQPVTELATRLGPERPLLHLDGAAAAGHVPLSFRTLGADLCSVTAHTWGGPPGAAALLVRRGLRLDPLLLGGAQERARRAGHEDVPAWIGFGAACAATDVGAEATVQRALIERAAAVLATVPGLVRYGDGSLPNLLCLGVEGVEAEPILLALDQHGVAAHSGSSCASEALEPSPVLSAMGVDAEHSLRISVGWSTTEADVDRFVAVLPGIIERLRGLRTP